MRKKVALPNDDWVVFLIALLGNHLQEQKDHRDAQVQAKQALLSRHREEMNQICLLTNPLEWVLAIHRYTSQFNELIKIGKFTQRLLKTRQAQERIKLEKWMDQFRSAATNEALFFDQLTKLFTWSLSQQQRQSYHQALNKGNTLVITDKVKSILWASHSFLTMTGYKPIDVIGRKPVFLQGPATDQATIDLIGERLRCTQAVNACLINYRKNGEPYQCYLKIEPLYNQQGKPTHFIAEEYEVKT